jgi:argininosuccinate synthase
VVDKKRILLAYSGGLDTSVALKWLIENYGEDVYCVIVDVGQEENLPQIAQRASKIGAKEVFIEDARDEFAQNYVFPMLRANPVYEGAYLMGSSIARPLIGMRQINLARRISAHVLAHGATGKGNDQIRFELTYAAVAPDLEVIAPWRIWNLRSRSDLIRYANELGMPISTDGNDSPLSIDRNLVHTSYEGGILEDPGVIPPSQLFGRVRDLENAEQLPQNIDISFVKGDAVAIDGKSYTPRELLETLNLLGAKHGIGRLDLVESRILGMKSRNVYETPGLSILLKAHRGAESMCIDKEVLHLKEELMPKYARMIYNGLWFAPERYFLQAAIDESQKNVNATIKLRLYRGNVDVVARQANNGLFSKELASFEHTINFDHSDASGYIKLNALRLTFIKKEWDRENE